MKNKFTKYAFYLILILFINSCKDNTEKQTYKNYLFLEFYEDMTHNDFDNITKKLISENKIRYYISNSSKTYYYKSGKCEVPLEFDFNSQGLRSVTLKNARCLIDNYQKKYKQVNFEEKNVSLISYLGYNEDFEPKSEYSNNGVAILCNDIDIANWLDEFKNKINSNPKYKIDVRNLSNNPTLIRKEKIIIEIKENREKMDLPESSLYSISHTGKSIRLINNNISEEDYMNNFLSHKEKPEDFYKRTRSRYKAQIKNKFYYRYNYDIKYQTTWNYDNKTQRLKNLKIHRKEENIEFKNKQNKRENSSYEEI